MRKHKGSGGDSWLSFQHWEAEAGRSLNLRPAWSVEWVTSVEWETLSWKIEKKDRGREKGKKKGERHIFQYRAGDRLKINRCELDFMKILSLRRPQ